MDLAKQQKEFEVLVNRAKRAGLQVHHYPENNVAVIRLVPPPADATPPAEQIPGEQKSAPGPVAPATN